ncbi:hypothetical protein BC831DRAFT_443411 [Entophlyctis helioformis]|nr:hypothetical protein BC831DRAFT_443411 [Entophlyctis helioformis]
MLFKSRYPFSATHDDELSFSQNQLIRVLQQIDAGGWWEGTTGSQVGWFPANYVERVDVAALDPDSIPLWALDSDQEHLQHVRRMTILNNSRKRHSHISAPASAAAGGPGSRTSASIASWHNPSAPSSPTLSTQQLPLMLNTAVQQPQQHRRVATVDDTQVLISDRRQSEVFIDDDDDDDDDDDQDDDDDSNTIAPRVKMQVSLADLSKAIVEEFRNGKRLAAAAQAAQASSAQSSPVTSPAFASSSARPTSAPSASVPAPSAGALGRSGAPNSSHVLGLWPTTSSPAMSETMLDTVPRSRPVSSAFDPMVGAGAGTGSLIGSPAASIVSPNTDTETDTDDEEEMEKKSNMRQRHLHAFFASEKRYLLDLQRFCSSVVLPLFLDTCPWLLMEQHKSMFGNIEEIVDFQESFMELLKREERSSDPCVGRAFMQIASEFNLLYVDYIRHLPESIETVNKLASHTMLTRFLQPLTELRPVTLFLIATLNNPAQRYQRYVIAFSDLLQDTPKHHPDYPFLVSALDSLNLIIQDIDLIKHDQEETHILDEMRAKVGEWNAPPPEDFGSWLLHGTFKVTNWRTMFPIPTTRDCYLFENMIVIVKKRNRHHKRIVDLLRKPLVALAKRSRSRSSRQRKSQSWLPTAIPFTKETPEWTITECIAVSPRTIQDVIASTRDQDAFHISFINSESKIVRLTFSTSNDYQRQDWFSRLNKRLQDLTQQIKEEQSQTQSRMSRLMVPLAMRDKDGKFVVPQPGSSVSVRPASEIITNSATDSIFNAGSVRRSVASSSRIYTGRPISSASSIGYREIQQHQQQQHHHHHHHHSSLAVSVESGASLARNTVVNNAQRSEQALAARQQARPPSMVSASNRSTFRRSALRELSVEIPGPSSTVMASKRVSSASSTSPYAIDTNSNPSPYAQQYHNSQLMYQHIAANFHASAGGPAGSDASVGHSAGDHGDESPQSSTDEMLSSLVLSSDVVDAELARAEAEQAAAEAAALAAADVALSAIAAANAATTHAAQAAAAANQARKLRRLHTVKSLPPLDPTIMSLSKAATQSPPLTPELARLSLYSHSSQTSGGSSSTHHRRSHSASTAYLTHHTAASASATSLGGGNLLLQPPSSLYASASVTAGSHSRSLSGSTVSLPVTPNSANMAPLPLPAPATRSSALLSDPQSVTITE